MDDDKFGYKVTDGAQEGRPSLCISVPGMRYPLRIILPPRNCFEGELLDATGCTSIDVPGTSYGPAPYPLCEDICGQEGSSSCVITQSMDDERFEEVRIQNVRPGVVCRDPNSRENRRRTVQGGTPRSNEKDRRPDFSRANRSSVSPNRTTNRNPLRNSRSPSPTKNIQNIPKQKAGTNCRLVCDFDESPVALPASPRRNSRCEEPRRSVRSTKNAHDVRNGRNFVATKKSISPEAAHVSSNARGYLNVCSQTDVPFGAPRPRICDEGHLMNMLLPTKNLVKRERYDNCCILKEKFDSIQVLAQAVYNTNCTNNPVARLIEHRESADQTDKVIDKRAMSVQTEKKPLKPAVKEISTAMSTINNANKEVETERPEEKPEPVRNIISPIKEAEVEIPEKTDDGQNANEIVQAENKKRERYAPKPSFVIVDDSLPNLKDLKEQKQPKEKSPSPAKPIVADTSDPSPPNAIPSEPIPEEKLENPQVTSVPDVAEEKPIENPPVPSDTLATPPERHICEYCVSSNCRCITTEEDKNIPKSEEKKLKFEDAPKQEAKSSSEGGILKKPNIQTQSGATLVPQQQETKATQPVVENQRQDALPIQPGQGRDLSAKSVPQTQLNETKPPGQNVEIDSEKPIEKEVSKADKLNEMLENFLQPRTSPERKEVISGEKPSNLELPADKSDRKVNIAPTNEEQVVPKSEDDQSKSIRDTNILGLSPAQSAENMEKIQAQQAAEEELEPEREPEDLFKSDTQPSSPKTISEPIVQPESEDQFKSDPQPSSPKIISEPTVHKNITPEMSKVTEPLETKNIEQKPKGNQNINKFDISYERDCPVFEERNGRNVRYSVTQARGVHTYECPPDVYEWRNCVNDRPHSMDSLDAARASCGMNRNRRRMEEQCEESVIVYAPEESTRPCLPRYVPSDDDRAQYFYVPTTSNKGTTQDPNCERVDHSRAENLAEHSRRSVRIQSEENQYFEDGSPPRRGIFGSIWNGLRNMF